MQGILKLPNDVVHGRSLRPNFGQTTHSNLAKHSKAIGSDLPLQRGVHYLCHGSVLVTVRNPITKRLLSRLRGADQRRTSAQYFKQHYPERVHVRLFRQMLSSIILWIYIPEAALNGGGADIGLGLARGPNSGKPKVRNFGHPLLIQQDVRAFDVAVDDCVFVGAEVEIMQRVRCVYTNLQALLPWQRRFVGVVEMVAEVATCHEIIDQDHLLLAVAVTEESNEIAMAQLREHLDLVPKLFGALL